MSRLHQPYKRHSCTLKVQGLHPKVTPADVRAAFSSFGKILSCRVENKTAFVEFENRNEAIKAQKEYDQQVVDGSKLKVSEVKQQGEKTKSLVGASRKVSSSSTRSIVGASSPRIEGKGSKESTNKPVVVRRIGDIEFKVRLS